MISKNSVKGAARALDVFEAFAAGGRPLTLSQLAGEIGVPASSCFSLIQTLLARGYLYVAGRRAYYPTRLMLESARRIAAQDPVSDALLATIAALRDESGETVILGKRQGDQVLYLASAESSQTIRYSTEIGAYKPLHSSAMGKAFLTLLDDAELVALLAELPLPRITPATLTTAEALAREVAAGRARGWTMTRGENVEDVMAVATILYLNGEPFGVTIAGPVYRMERGLDNHVAALMGLDRSLGAA